MEGYPGEFGERFEERPKETTDFFKPGDTVYKILVRRPLKKCLLCGGNGKVKAKIGKEPYLILCPKCVGKGEQEKTCLSVEKTEIGYSTLLIRTEKNRDWIWHVDNSRNFDGKSAGEYLTRFFPTEKEAAEYAENVNEALEKV